MPWRRRSSRIAAVRSRARGIFVGRQGARQNLCGYLCVVWCIHRVLPSSPSIHRGRRRNSNRLHQQGSLRHAQRRRASRNLPAACAMHQPPVLVLRVQMPSVGVWAQLVGWRPALENLEAEVRIVGVFGQPDRAAVVGAPAVPLTAAPPPPAVPVQHSLPHR